MLEENKIQDIFKQTSLKDEDWLEPSAMVFQNIEETIYKKKRKRWFWLLIIPFLGVLGIFTFIFYKNDISNQAKNEITSTKTNKQTAEQTSTIGLVEKSNDTNDLDAKLKTDASKLEITALETTDKTSISKTKENSTTKTKSKFRKERNETTTSSKIKNTAKIAAPFKEAEQTKPNTSIKKNILTVNTIDEVLSKKPSTLDNTENEKLNLVISKPNVIEPVANVVSISDIANNENQTDSSSNEVVVNELFDKLQLILPDVLIYEEGKPDLLKLDNVIPNLLKEPTTNWSLGIFSGFSSWDYILNNNLKAVLRPAEFTYTNSIGYFVAIEAKKALNKKFSVVGNLSFESIRSKSGHNATVNYDPVNENNENISSYDLKMASTLGFIDANLEIQRQNDASIDATPVVIDLNNQHQISSIDLSTYLSANLFSISNTSASVRLGLGLAQIIRIKNELTSFSSSLPLLSPHNSKIIANQNELNKTRTFVAFGAGLTHQLNATNNLFLSYTFKSDFNALYQSGELSSFLNKHNVGVGYQKRF